MTWRRSTVDDGPKSVSACPKKKCHLAAGHDDDEHGTNEQARFNRMANRRFRQRTRPTFDSVKRASKIARPRGADGKPLRDLVQVHAPNVHPRHLRNP